jgi:hypothetical protein
MHHVVGFVEIRPNNTVIFSQAVEWPYEIDIRRAQEAKEQRLKQANTETARERELRLFELKLDLEQQLFALEDIIEEYVPDDNIERPTDALWRWAVFAIRLVRFRLKYERYED